MERCVVLEETRDKKYKLKRIEERRLLLSRHLDNLVVQKEI